MKTHPLGLPFEPVSRTHLKKALAEFDESMRVLRETPNANEKAVMWRALIVASSLAQHVAAYLAESGES